MLTSSQWLWCISWSTTNISTSLLCFFSVIVGVIRQFPTMQKQILKPYVCNQCKINFFMFEKVSLYHTCNGGKVCLFQKYNILLLFLDHRFCLICLIIALVLLNYPSEYSNLIAIYSTYSNWCSITKQLKQHGLSLMTQLNLPSDNTLTFFPRY